jgi:hypothetical protein
MPGRSVRALRDRSVGIELGTTSGAFAGRIGPGFVSTA